MNRQSWSSEEDNIIVKLVEEYGIEDWTKIASKLRDNFAMLKRTGKQCRQRWYNHLNPTVNKLPWSKQEEEQLFALHRTYGNSWKDISKQFVGRTDNDIKNHFYSKLRRSLRRLNKILGEKNSTTQMREIKPSVLSTIMYYIYEGQKIKQENQLALSLQYLPILIFEFANFKPIKSNIKGTNIQEIRQKTNQIFNLIDSFNIEYQKNKAMRNYLKNHKKRQLKYEENGASQHEFKDQMSQVQVDAQSEHQQPKVKIEEQGCLDYYNSYRITGDFKDYDSSELVKQPTPKQTQKNDLSQPHQEQNNYEIKQNEIISSNSCQIQKPYPSSSNKQMFKQHRRISLEADELNDLQLNAPEEPSQMMLRENGVDGMTEEQADVKLTTYQQAAIIDQVMDMHFKH